MATSKTAKKIVPKAAPAAPTLAPVVAQPAAPKSITIVVVDDKSQPVSGANISINPSGTVGTTNASGEYVFGLGNYPKYDITASYGSNSATVPYYVTRDGATRIVVSPTYIKVIQDQRSPSHFSGIVMVTGIGLVVAIGVYFVWKMFQRPE